MTTKTFRERVNEAFASESVGQITPSLEALLTEIEDAISEEADSEDERAVEALIAKQARLTQAISVLTPGNIANVRQSLVSV